VALVIVGREFTILGLRAAVASGGRHMETSMLGKWKATVQFVAIGFAMFRPDVTIGGEYLDEWLMVVAALVTAWSGIDYLLKFSAALRSSP
jgi:phosphatidylglycerophosphate synthase